MAEGNPQVSWKDGKGKGFVCLCFQNESQSSFEGCRVGILKGSGLWALGADKLKVSGFRIVVGHCRV